MAMPSWVTKKVSFARPIFMSPPIADEKAAYTSLVTSVGSDDDSESEDLALPMLAEEGYALELFRRSQPSRTSTWIRRIATVLLLLWAAASSILILTPKYDPQSRSCSCGGTTVAEALRRGCIFTPLAIAWLPPHCIDMELSDQFDKLGPGPNGEWEYWADPNRTIPMTREEMGMLADVDGVFYTTQDWHIQHCTTTWRKHYRQKTTGVTIERRSNGIDHIGHCEGVFQVRAGLQDIATVAGIALDADDPGETDFHDFQGGDGSDPHAAHKEHMHDEHKDHADHM